MIGLLLPLWLNLESGGGPAPVHHDAPGIRKIPVIPESRTIDVLAENRLLAVPAENRVILVTDSDEMETRTKDPNDTLDFTRDWGGFLEEDELLVSVSWSINGDPTMIGSGSYAPTISSDGKRCTVWLNGGTVGTTYEIRARGTTDNSPARIKDATFKLRVEEQ